MSEAKEPRVGDGALGAGHGQDEEIVSPVAAVPGVFFIQPPVLPPYAVLSSWHAMVSMRKRSLMQANEGDGSTREAPRNKPTHVARREEKDNLEKEVEELEAQVVELRKKAGVVGLTAMERRLRDAVDQHRLMLACAQSMFSEYARSQTASPLESFIHLTKDWKQRQARLLGLRGPKVAAARRFLEARMRFMRATNLTSEVSKTQHEDGSFCTIKLSVTPFRGLQSAKQVYDALLFYFFNMEISISEFTGATTVNENHEDANEMAQGVLCHRLVTEMGDDTLVEKNSIQFIDLQEPGMETIDPKLGGNEFVLITSDFVNEDELYPYCRRVVCEKTSIPCYELHRIWTRTRSLLSFSSTGFMSEHGFRS